MLYRPPRTKTTSPGARWPRKAVSPITLRTRELRERAKSRHPVTNLIDPIKCVRVRLRKSEIDQIVLGLDTVRPEDRNKPIYDAAWDEEFGLAAAQLIREALSLKRK